MLVLYIYHCSYSGHTSHALTGHNNPTFSYQGKYQLKCNFLATFPPGQCACMDLIYTFSSDSFSTT